MENGDNIKIVSDEEIVEVYDRFDFSEDTVVDLNNFLCKRKKYLLADSPENLIEMQQAFDNIYHNTKLSFHMEIISERDFIYLIEMLREGV
ncbi:MAG: hypothetical protein R3Y24_07065 [Eubacteriales bacterium]